MRTSPHLSDDDLLLELALVETDIREPRVGERPERAEQVLPRGYRSALHA